MAAKKEEMSAYELLIQRNIQQNKQKMKELGILNDDFAKQKSEPLTENNNVIRRLNFDSEKEGNNPVLVSAEKRRSRRLASRQLVHFTDEVARPILGDINSCYVSWGYDSDMCDSESSSIDDDDIKHVKKIQRTRQVNGEKEIPSVDEITEDDLNRVAEQVRDKVYSQDGTTCHQCRQKTEDQKTICRSSACLGVRGQFCGPCLKNRYGESVATALKDPEWTCPPCRNMCNCSICRTLAGKMPTGQLVSFAQKRGYDSVKHLLDVEDEN